jgi:hypothetical protein
VCMPYSSAVAGFLKTFLLVSLLQVFEDNLAIWMDGFHQLLTLPDSIKALFVQGDDEKLTSMHQMQRSVCEAILLYADKVRFF